jgi:peptidoglycan hydrolase-like protein with peptidoglycan-binding domain
MIIIDEVQRFGVFTESLHPRASGKFAKKAEESQARKAAATKAAAAKGGAGKSSAAGGGAKGSLSFDGKRGAGYGTPGGDKRVHSLQKALNRLGFGDGAGKPLKDDGKLGPKTTAAIKRAQRAMGLKADGAVTPALLAKLTKAKSSKDLKATKTPAKKVAAKKAAPAKKAPMFTKPAPAAKKAAPVQVHTGR